MADVETNTNSSLEGNGSSATTPSTLITPKVNAQPPGGLRSAETPPSNASPPADESEGATAPPATAQAPETPTLFVDGMAVSEEGYFKAAGENGYDVARLREMNYRPDIRTTKHGEV